MRAFIVAAFTDTAFRGNPAGVCLCDGAPPAPATMQAIAAELRQPETAFVSRDGDGWAIRWFSPVTEVELCGHATLAAAAVLWATGAAAQAQIAFDSAGGPLAAERDGGLIWLDFPALPGVAAPPPPEVAACVDVAWIAAARHGERWLLECADAGAVRSARPDFARLRATGIRSLILTAPSDVAGYDIVSRNFAPIVGVDEDQVTGSAHACLAPHWRGRLGPALTCWQASPRGGAVRTRLAGDRVALGGSAVIAFSGVLDTGSAAIAHQQP